MAVAIERAWTIRRAGAMLGLWSGRLGHGMMELEPALAETMQSVGGRIPAASLTTPVVVVQFPDIWGRNVSPFGLKLEAWLRLADIPYTVEPSTDLGKAPQGQAALHPRRRVG